MIFALVPLVSITQYEWFTMVKYEGYGGTEARQKSFRRGLKKLVTSRVLNINPLTNFVGVMGFMLRNAQRIMKNPKLILKIWGTKILERLSNITVNYPVITLERLFFNTRQEINVLENKKHLEPFLSAAKMV